MSHSQHQHQSYYTEPRHETASQTNTEFYAISPYVDEVSSHDSYNTQDSHAFQQYGSWVGETETPRNIDYEEDQSYQNLCDYPGSNVSYTQEYMAVHRPWSTPNPAIQRAIDSYTYTTTTSFSRQPHHRKNTSPQRDPHMPSLVRPATATPTTTQARNPTQSSSNHLTPMNLFPYTQQMQPIVNLHSITHEELRTDPYHAIGGIRRGPAMRGEDSSTHGDTEQADQQYAEWYRLP